MTMQSKIKNKGRPTFYILLGKLDIDAFFIIILILLLKTGLRQKKKEKKRV